ncbi:hypothetical protein ABBQ32_011592 [Trebouxia sp. C0010 RCD-2024]
MAPSELNKLLVRANTVEANSPRIAALHLNGNRAIGFDEQQERDLVQWFAKLNLLLPALSATARVEPVDGDGFCVVYSMLASQGCDIDEETIEDCLGRAQHNCQQFLAKSGMDVVSFYS